MENVRIRYGKVQFGRPDSMVPKNTLATVRKGNKIYFGISRCLLTADRPDKKKGKERALRRLNVALQKVAGSWIVDGSLYIHKSGLLGVVDVGEVKKLLSYFDNIDEICRVRGMQ